MALRVAAEKDVLVVGGGSAGVAAAIGAARNGADVLLVEKNGVVGGTSVMSWVAPFMNFHSPDGSAVIGGYIDEVVDRMVELGGSPGSLLCTGKPPWGINPTITPMDPMILTGLYLDMLREAGVDILFHTFVSDALVADNRVKGIEIQNKDGRQLVWAKSVVDASGDADVAHMAGANCEKGRPSDQKMQPATLYFRIGNVDLQQVHDFLAKYPEEFRWWGIPHYVGDVPTDFEPNPITFAGFLSLIAEAKEAGELVLGRETLNGFAVMRKGQVIANCTRVNNVDGTNTKDLTRAEISARDQIRSFINFARKRLPGFSEAHVVDTAMSIGIRETRRIVGDYMITQEDVVSGAKFDDVIARSAYPIDIHNPDDAKSTWIQLADTYDIPYRSLMPAGTENLLVAGRCISATHEAHASTRVIPNCMAMGVAAGTAAAMASDRGSTPRELSVPELQERLVNKMGANLGVRETARK